MNRIDLDGRKAIVTGAAKGIGYATAARMLESGAVVGLWDRDGTALEAAAEALARRGTVHPYIVDVADAEAVGRAAEDALGRLGGVDVLVANAGIAGIIKPAQDYTLEEWDRLIAQDLTSVFLTCRALLPAMLERGYGRIVVVASIAGHEGAANNAAYSAAKAGAIGFTKALGKELAHSGVLANCVVPSGIDTPLLSDVTGPYLEAVLAKMPIGRLGRPEEAAALIAWLASEDCSFSAGAVFDLSGGRADY